MPDDGLYSTGKSYSGAWWKLITWSFELQCCSCSWPSKCNCCWLLGRTLSGGKFLWNVDWALHWVEFSIAQLFGPSFSFATTTEIIFFSIFAEDETTISVHVGTFCRGITFFTECAQKKVPFHVAPCLWIFSSSSIHPPGIVSDISHISNLKKIVWNKLYHLLGSQ